MIHDINMPLKSEFVIYTTKQIAYFNDSKIDDSISTFGPPYNESPLCRCSSSCQHSICLLIW